MSWVHHIPRSMFEIGCDLFWHECIISIDNQGNSGMLGNNEGWQENQGNVVRENRDWNKIVREKRSAVETKYPCFFEIGNGNNLLFDDDAGEIWKKKVWGKSGKGQGIWRTDFCDNPEICKFVYWFYTTLRRCLRETSFVSKQWSLWMGSQILSYSRLIKHQLWSKFNQ